jgi:DAACS family dicarboxylate/amino acid:cation (Na+ or H+) symporter
MLMGVVLGGVLGALGHAVGAGSGWLDLAIAVLEPVGRIFLRLLFVLVVPLVFASLSLGVSDLGDLRNVGRLGLKTLAATVTLSSMAVLVGVGLTNLLAPGAGVSEAAREALLLGAAERAGTVATPSAGVDLVVRMVPDNAIKAAADGDMIGVIFASVLFGVGLAVTRTAATTRVEEVLRGVLDVLMALLAFVIRLAPLGVGALVFVLFATTGWSLVSQLAAYVATVLLGLGLQLVVVYGLAIALASRVAPRRFLQGIQAALITAFSTASSAATLPTTLRVAREMGFPEPISRFVLTVGATANQNGTALFEGVTVLFLAQFYGIDLTLAQQVGIAFLCILAGIGTAGVPAGSIPVVALLLGMFGIPVEGIGLILGVDRFLDMCRTALNVAGDLVITAIVSGEPAVGPPRG